MIHPAVSAAGPYYATHRVNALWCRNDFIYIKQGVGITFLLCRSRLPSKCLVKVAELWGTREQKYKKLSSLMLSNTEFFSIEPKAPYFYLVMPNETEGSFGWESWPTVAEVFTKRSTGTETGFDDLLINFTLLELKKRVTKFADPLSSREIVSQAFDFSDGHASVLYSRRKELEQVGDAELRRFQLRAYDYRYALLRKNLLKTNSFNVMTELSPDMPGLVTTRQTKEDFAAFAVCSFCGHKVTSSYDRSYVFPLFTAGQTALVMAKTTCLDRAVLRHFAEIAKKGNMPFSDENQLAVEIFNYCISVLNAPSYSVLFSSALKRDWPRVPLTINSGLFKSLAKLGGELVALHLMEFDVVGADGVRPEQPGACHAPLQKTCKLLTTFVGAGSPVVEKVSYSDETVWIDKAKSQGVQGVPENVWNFHIGGYQVCEKWLKDRGPKGGKPGRTLSADDINHYHCIVVALNETIRIMAEIDKVIDEHGGWPDAFAGQQAENMTTYKEFEAPLLKAAEESTPYERSK